MVQASQFKVLFQSAPANRHHAYRAINNSVGAVTAHHSGPAAAIDLLRITHGISGHRVVIGSSHITTGTVQARSGHEKARPAYKNATAERQIRHAAPQSPENNPPVVVSQPGSGPAQGVPHPPPPGVSMAISSSASSVTDPLPPTMCSVPCRSVMILRPTAPSLPPCSP